MSSNHTGTVSRIVYTRSKHGKLQQRYMNGEYRTVGEEGEYGRVDPDTNAEYVALVGPDNRYNRDYKIGGAYPETVFVYGADGGNAVTHEILEEYLRENGLWSDALTPVMFPKGNERGEYTWWYAFQYRPPERAPSTTSRIVSQVEKVSDNVWEQGSVVEAYVTDE